MDVYIFNLLSRITDYSILIPFIAAILRIKVALPSKDGMLLYTFIFVSFVKTITVYFTELYGIKNIYLYNWFNLIESLTIFGIYYFSIDKSIPKKAIIVAFIFAIVISFSKPQYYLNTNIIDLHRISMIVVGALSIAVVLIYFYELVENLRSPNILVLPIFWLSCGVLIYSAGTIISYIYSSVTFNSPDYDERRIYWTLEFFFRVIFNVFLAISVWFIKSPKRI